jgi:hypothetical protein
MRVEGFEPSATVWKTVNLTINRYSLCIYRNKSKKRNLIFILQVKLIVRDFFLRNYCLEKII